MRVGSVMPDEFFVKVGMQQDSALLLFLFATVMDDARNGVLHEILYVDDLVQINESMEDLQRKFSLLKATLKSKGVKVNINKTKLMVSGTEGGTSISKIDSCGICGKRVMVNAIMCIKYRYWVHKICKKRKKLLVDLALSFASSRCNGMTAGTVAK